MYMITKFKLYESINDWLSKKGKYIGKGGFGKVFEIIGHPNLVLKITKDQSEYKTARKLIGKNTEYIVKFYEAEPYQNGSFFLIMDKINTILPQNINNILDELNIYCYDYDNDFYYETLFNDEEIEFIIEDYIEDYPEKDVKFVINQLQKIVKECKENDIYTNDFHSKNIGQKNGHLIFFDVGAQKLK